MNEELQEIMKEVEDIQVWGFEDCPQRFQLTNAIKKRVLSIIKRHIKKGEKHEKV